MRGTAPFVVVMAAATSRVGRSTLAANLAVYLRGLDEDLPVAVVSFDPGFDPAHSLELQGALAPSVSHLFGGGPLEEQLGVGQFGVDYLSGGLLPQLTAPKLRALLRDSSYPGILIIDAGPLGEKPASAALQSADLVLSPVRDAAGLSALAGIRREIKAGGGNDKMLWLIPSMVDDPQEQARQIKFLRFAARERGCQILDDEYLLDARLPQALKGAGGSILTRMPESKAHDLLIHLARLVMARYGAGFDTACQLQRLRTDQALPPRFRRVEVICPLCGKLACFGSSHYSESLPQRRRWLLHSECLQQLLEGRKLQPFWNSGQSMVLRTGVEGEGLKPWLRLLLPDADGAFYESELFQAREDSAWQALVRKATGLTLAEQFPSVLMVYPAISGRRVLTRRWYQSCQALRRRLRAGLSAEL